MRIMPPLLPSREIARDTVFRTKACEANEAQSCQTVDTGQASAIRKIGSLRRDEPRTPLASCWASTPCRRTPEHMKNPNLRTSHAHAGSRTPSSRERECSAYCRRGELRTPNRERHLNQSAAQRDGPHGRTRSVVPSCNDQSRREIVLQATPFTHREVRTCGSRHSRGAARVRSATCHSPCSHMRAA